MQIAIKKWGNSQGVMLSKELLSILGVRVGDFLDIDVNNGQLVAKKACKHKTLEERIKESGVPLELSKELDWGESRGTELW